MTVAQQIGNIIKEAEAGKGIKIFELKSPNK